MESWRENPLPTPHSACNASVYTLDTITQFSRPGSPPNDGSSLLLSSADPSSLNYGSLPPTNAVSKPWFKGIVLRATLKMAVIFVVSCIVLGGTLWLALPTLDEEDRPSLKIPKSFVELQTLNHLLKKYRDIYPFRIFLCYVVTYLFLQAFSLPGSMYLSILGGAVWGIPRALPLACTCVASGATLCYLLSAALGPAILTLPKWKQRLTKWSEKIQAQRDNLIPFLIVLRIAPLPPHWVINVICPHVGIGLIPFWLSTFLGVFGVSVIHTTIGGGLDEMTSADDFHLISWRNFLGLSAVVVGVLIPVGLRYYFKRELASVTDIESSQSMEVGEDEGEDTILAQGPRANRGKAKANAQLILLDDDNNDRADRSAAGSDSEEFDFEDDEDIILEAGPAIVIKPTDIPSHDDVRHNS